MESIPSTSTSRVRKHRASLSIEDIEKRRAADRIRKARKRSESKRQQADTRINELNAIDQGIIFFYK